MSFLPAAALLRRFAFAHISYIISLPRRIFNLTFALTLRCFGGTIHITTKNDKVFVSVKDHGIGISRKEINKIWERFYKSDLSRGKDKKGTGLGLSIVKEIIQAHDEHINVISTEGVGTEFIFTLPIAKDKE